MISSAEPAPRDRILRAARRTFAEAGYSSGSLNDVATGAGMSRQNVLYYFSSKRDLLLALLEARDDEADRRLQWIEGGGDVPLALFIDGLVGVMASVFEDRELMLLHHRLTTEAIDESHPAHEWVAARYRRVRDSTKTVLTRAQRRGELAPDLDVEPLTVALLGAVEGVELQWLVDPSTDWHAALRSVRVLVEQAAPTVAPRG